MPGAFLALYVTGSTLSMPAMIGLIMRRRNSILLVDCAVIAREQRGWSRTEAVIGACRKRARPIVMATIAMARGCCRARRPGAATEFQGAHGHRGHRGVMSSTFLSLLVIPVVVTGVDDLLQGLRRRMATRHSNGAHAPPVGQRGARTDP